MIHNVVKKNTYFDSVSLMLISSKVSEVKGINQAAIMMGSDQNIDLMKDSDVLEEKNIEGITPNDLVIGINGENQEAIDEALKILDEQLENKDKKSSSSGVEHFKTFNQAKEANNDLNVSVVSIPGRFAKSEVMKSLRSDTHVMLFSDNVSVEDEIAMKDYAVKNDLLMMGPDCGTAIINGVALGFANVIDKGNIGITAASGTGLQEVSVIIDKLGGGVSQALGTGGRDLKEAIDGKMMLFTLDALKEDDQTEVIGIVSKPPSKRVMEKIVKKAESIDKPIVACFLGGSLDVFEGTNIIGTKTLEEAAYAMVKASKKETLDSITNSPLTLNTDDLLKQVETSKAAYIKGLYTGGTLAYESLLMLHETLGGVYSNIALDDAYDLKNPDESFEHTVLDMGEDYFTDGRPHPMIDPDARADRIVKEAKDEKTGIILIDCVLGYGSHEDPVASIVKAASEVKKTRKDITFIASVTGTKNDPQNLARSQKALEEAGIFVLPTNAQAAKFSLEVLKKRGVFSG